MIGKNTGNRRPTLLYPLWRRIFGRKEGLHQQKPDPSGQSVRTPLVWFYPWSRRRLPKRTYVEMGRLWGDISAMFIVSSPGRFGAGRVGHGRGFPVQPLGRLDAKVGSPCVQNEFASARTSETVAWVYISDSGRRAFSIRIRESFAGYRFSRLRNC